MVKFFVKINFPCSSSEWENIVKLQQMSLEQSKLNLSDHIHRENKIPENELLNVIAEDTHHLGFTPILNKLNNDDESLSETKTSLIISFINKNQGCSFKDFYDYLVNQNNQYSKDIIENRKLYYGLFYSSSRIINKDRKFYTKDYINQSKQDQKSNVKTESVTKSQKMRKVLGEHIGYNFNKFIEDLPKIFSNECSSLDDFNKLKSIVYWEISPANKNSKFTKKDGNLAFR